MQASLADASMWAKFQVKIHKYSLAAKVGCYRKNHYNLDISLETSQKPELFTTIDTVH
jgi:hypothetical protein